MKLFRSLVLLILFLNFNTHAYSQVNIMFIDLDFIFKNSSVGKSITKNAIDERNKKIKENQKVEKSLETQKNDILSKKDILNKEEFEKKVITHQKEVQKYQLKKNKEFNEMKKKNSDLTKNFMKEVDKILLNYAKENKIDLILKKDTLIISNSDMDITKTILTLVDKEIKK